VTGVRLLGREAPAKPFLLANTNGSAGASPSNRLRPATSPAGIFWLSAQSPAGLRFTVHPNPEVPMNPSSSERAEPALPVPAKQPITLKVNGQSKQVEVQPWTTLLDLLREQLHLYGTKKGCDHGQCGACTVLLNGQRINSCLTFAIMHDGAEITTIEGVAQGDALHPVQQGFIDHDAFQCGYCTSGQICSAVALINEGRAKEPDDIRELMSGNICRCGAYAQIVAAIQQAMQQEGASR
jgi:xanthine dehydrogenase YagT iron-sulfur-binding subunit